MTATLGAIAPWLVLGALLLTLALLYGRAREDKGGADERAERAEGDDAADKRVEEQRSRPRTRDHLRRWLRRAAGSESDSDS